MSYIFLYTLSLFIVLYTTLYTFIYIYIKTEVGIYIHIDCHSVSRIESRRTLFCIYQEVFQDTFDQYLINKRYSN